MKIPQCPAGLKIGDYVFATRWGDADWNDPWCVGFVAGIGRNFVSLSNHDGSRIDGVGARGFRYAIVVTAEQAKAILSEYPRREGLPFDDGFLDQLMNRT